MKAGLDIASNRAKNRTNRKQQVTLARGGWICRLDTYLLDSLALRDGPCRRRESLPCVRPSSGGSVELHVAEELVHTLLCAPHRSYGCALVTRAVRLLQQGRHCRGKLEDSGNLSQRWTTTAAAEKRGSSSDATRGPERMTVACRCRRRPISTRDDGSRGSQSPKPPSTGREREAAVESRRIGGGPASVWARGRSVSHPIVTLHMLRERGEAAFWTTGLVGQPWHDAVVAEKVAAADERCRVLHL